MDQKNIGRYIALKRKLKNITQEQLAEVIGVSNKTISKWETGKCMPDYSTIPVLCDALEISLAELLDGEDIESNSMRLYDERQTLELIKTIQVRANKNTSMEIARSIMLGAALLAIAYALYDSHDFIAGLLVGLTIVIIATSVYLAVSERRYAAKSKENAG